MAEATTADATSTETTESTTTTETVDTTETTDDLDAMRDALKKANAEAKKFRLAAKANETELEKARQESMSEQEKVVAQAKAEGLAEGTRNAGLRLVDAEVRAAAAGRGIDTDALLKVLDRSKFLDDEGEPDTTAIAEWVEEIAPAEAEERGDGFKMPDLGQGTRKQSMALNGDPLERALRDALHIR